MEKTKIKESVKTTSLSHSAKQGNSNSNISNRVTEIEDSIGANNREYEDKKNVIILGDSIIKHVNAYDVPGKLNR